jgi:hypothetical protein
MSAQWTPAVGRAVTPVGKPDAGNQHVRFDERRRETEPALRSAATAPVLDSTNSVDLPPRRRFIFVAVRAPVEGKGWLSNHSALAGSTPWRRHPRKPRPLNDAARDDGRGTEAR